MVVYLKCSSNNRSSTVYSLFISAVNHYGLPSRLRSDQGRENYRVAQHMIEHRGAGRRSMITGSLVHNQRIERFWRDLHYAVTNLFYGLFYHMEHLNIFRSSKRAAFICTSLCIYSTYKFSLIAIQIWMEQPLHTHRAQPLAQTTICFRSSSLTKIWTCCLGFSQACGGWLWD